MNCSIHPSHILVLITILRARIKEISVQKSKPLYSFSHGLGVTLHVLEIYSGVLSIAFEHKLNWEVDNLIVHTSHSDFYFESSQIDPLVTRNITVSSISGYAYGEYVANGNLIMRSEVAKSV
jgi:hypothetical protein